MTGLPTGLRAFEIGIDGAARLWTLKFRYIAAHIGGENDGALTEEERARLWFHCRAYPQMRLGLKRLES